MRQIVMNEIEVKALPKHLPASIQVDISHLSIGDKLFIEDIQMPADVECLSEATAVVATVLHVQKVSEEEELEMDEVAKDEGLKDDSGAKLVEST